jgi:hypothetical protein
VIRDEDASGVAQEVHLRAKIGVGSMQAIPQRGDFIRVRTRRWLVEGERERGAGLTSLTLACVDDDAQGETAEPLSSARPRLRASRSRGSSVRPPPHDPPHGAPSRRRLIAALGSRRRWLRDADSASERLGGRMAQKVKYPGPSSGAPHQWPPPVSPVSPSSRRYSNLPRGIAIHFSPISISTPEALRR